jgi:parallel beta-helix repeat protein
VYGYYYNKKARRMIMMIKSKLRMSALIICALFLFTNIASVPVFAEGSAPPVISYITGSVDEGGTMIIMGENFTPDANVWLWRPQKDDFNVLKENFGAAADPLPGTPPQGAIKTTVLGTPESHMMAAVQVGGQLAVTEGTMPTVAWVETPAGLSQPYMLNKPELFFLSEPEVLPGQNLRIFGRNLQTRFEINGPEYDLPVAFRDTKSSSVYWGTVLVNESQERANLKAYQLNVLVPKEIVPGDYDVSVHVGYGGQQGWSNKLSVKVVASRDFIAQLADNGDPQIATPVQKLDQEPKNIKLQNLQADGFHDDTAKIQHAIDTIAENGGGKVILPSGQIAVSETIHVKPGVVLEGMGRGSTSLVVSSDNPFTGEFPVKTLFNSPSWIRGFVGDYYPYIKGMVPMVWLDNKTGLQNLSVVVGAGADIAVLVATEDPQSIVKDTFIKRTDIENLHKLLYKAKDSWAPYFGGIFVTSPTEGFTVVGNNVVAHETLNMLSGRYEHKHALIEENVFDGYPNNDANNVFLNGIFESIIENNEIKNGARGFISQMGFSRNFISGNVIHNIGGHANASEILMSEHGSTLFTGNVKSASTDTVTLDVDLGFQDDQITTTSLEFYAFVKTGRGMGQYRKIIGNSTDNTLKLETPWNIIPDSTSKVNILTATVKNLFTNNWVTDTRGDLQFVYGISFDNIVAGNELHNASSLNLFGLFDTWTSQGKAFVDPGAYNLIYANRIVNSGKINLYGYSSDKYQYGSDPLYDGGVLFANTIRRNQIWSPSTPIGANQYYNIWMLQGKNGANDEGAINVIGSAFTVVEGNYIYNSKNGIKVDGGKHNIIRENRMDDVTNRLLLRNNPDGTYAAAPSWEDPYNLNSSAPGGTLDVNNPSGH